MNIESYIKQGLQLQQYPIYESDIPFIMGIFLTIHQAEDALAKFPYLQQEVPITIVDKEFILWRT